MSRLRINFRAKKQKAGNTPYIYCRITYNGRPATDFSTSIPYSEKWNQSAQMFVGSDSTSRYNTDQLSGIVTEIQLIEKDLKQKYGITTAAEIRSRYVKKTQTVTLLQCYERHLKEFQKNNKANVKGFSDGTLKGRKTRFYILQEFLKDTGRKDILLPEITLKTGIEFIHFLRHKKKYKQNFLCRNIELLKSILDTAVKDEYLERNPIEHLTELRTPPGDPVYLTESQIFLLKSNPLLSDSLQRIADAFLLQCYTGLAYCDLKRFDPEKHLTTIQGRKVIQFRRQKGSVMFTIPVLPYAEHLIKKYSGNLPIISNQKMNEYLQIIARTVGISVHLTTHVGRKTAGTYLLNNDVPMEVVSKILGHRSVKTTEKIYAFMLQETILRHTAHLVA